MIVGCGACTDVPANGPFARGQERACQGRRARAAVSAVRAPLNAGTSLRGVRACALAALQRATDGV